MGLSSAKPNKLQQHSTTGFEDLMLNCVIEWFKKFGNAL
jgi:hypothetical protein